MSIGHNLSIPAGTLTVDTIGHPNGLMRVDFPQGLKVPELKYIQTNMLSSADADNALYFEYQTSTADHADQVVVHKDLVVGNINSKHAGGRVSFPHGLKTEQWIESDVFRSAVRNEGAADEVPSEPLFHYEDNTAGE